MCYKCLLLVLLLFTVFGISGCSESQPKSTQQIDTFRHSENTSVAVPATSTPTRPEPVIEPAKKVTGFIFQTYDGKSWQINHLQEGTGTSLKLTGEIADDLEPDWSPSGSKVAFAMHDNNVRQIFTVDIVGGGLRKLTSGTVDLYTPKWSPDGAKIVFVSQLSIPERSFETCVYPSGSIFVMNADGSNIHDVTANHEEIRDCINVTPAWSPDSRRIAFASFKINIQSKQYFANLLYNFWATTKYPDIFIVDADGSNLINITETSKDSEISPAWSPDGKKIVFIANREGGQWLEDDWQVYIYQVAGRETSRLGDNDLKWNIIGISKNFGERVITYASESFGPYISWSPDGNLLSTQVFGHLVIADSSKGAILGEYPGVSQYYCWSPYSNKIAYIPVSTVLNHTSGDIMVMNVDGSNSRPVSAGASGHLSWHPQ